METVANLSSNGKDVNNWHVNQTPSCGNIKSLILLDIVAYCTVVRYMLFILVDFPSAGKMVIFLELCCDQTV